jgi:hypothetical protein
MSLSFDFKLTIKLVTLLLCMNINTCLAKLKPIAPPYLEKKLEDFHFKLDKYENKLGYLNDKYLLVYGHSKTWLYDMNGVEYKTWNTDVKRAQLLKNCNLMVIDNHQQNEITEKNYSGEVVWSHKLPGPTHHDFEITEDGHITLFYYKQVPEDFKFTNNCKHDQMLTDVIVEIDRKGKVYYEWPFYRHYGNAFNIMHCTKEKLARQAESNYAPYLDPIHPNALDVLQDNKWYRMGYKEFKPGNIIVTLHHLRQVIIIDKDTNRVVWLYDGTTDKSGIRLDGPHEAKMIAEGLPGAGNIIIFDNGLHERKYTIIREINPITKKTVWEYKKPLEFYSKFAGSWQRLKNGDTFISDDGSGRAFIVNKKGKIKWQFVREQHWDGVPWVKRARLYPKDEFAHCLK